MTVREQVAAIARANAVLAHLEADPTTSRERLGAARDLVNRVHNHSEAETVRQALEQLDALTGAA